jgi:beta-phosphoglucomutase
VSIVRAVLFDLDGTLIDSMPAHVIAWSRILKDMGIEIDGRYIRLHEGEKAEYTIAQLAREHGHILTPEGLADVIRRKRALYRTMAPQGLIPEARALIDELRTRAIECDIVTGSIRSNMNGVVSAEELALFTHIVAADDYDRGKPAPDPYLKGIAMSGFHREECLALENAPLGIQSALAAQLRTIAVTTTLPAADLQLPGCIVINHYSEVLRFL